MANPMPPDEPTPIATPPAKECRCAERIAETLDDLALTMVSTEDDAGTALTAAVLHRAARIAREFA